ncbi:formate/nitrite transporter family (FNT) [Fulvivirga imtechensis AK7]|uniref:Formate/nitrite transporter family (FNT) n=1 Tax=Fulvivirga imtechensis AK7 TaxID=1237149 RepID=L8JLH3_9BACT|nr:formate/nitrite transporter family protein [Fulvivirga imtechensis]ELR68349.1 formate/nitrite transporter family (FNT) [Fulvivirga imtechensis AK7]
MKLQNIFRSKPQKVEDVSNEPKTVYHIFREQINTGLAVHNRSSQGLFASSLAAGLEVGFTLFLSGVLYTLLHPHISEYAMHLVIAFAYPIGFIFVIIGRSELFTEHTTLAVIPVLRGSASIKSLARLWSIIYVGNLIGGYVMAMILSGLGPTMGIISDNAFYHLAHNMVKYNWLVILGSSILAGWLMGQLSWLVTSSQETISRILMIVLITSLIGLGGLHHSIVGSIEVFAGVITSRIEIVDYFHFQFWTTLGNIIGGVVFVSVIKFSTIKFSEMKKKDKTLE